MPVGLAGGDLRAGIRLYHPKDPEGRTFRPIPEDDHLQRLARAGWVDTPRKLPGYQDPEMVPGLGPNQDDYTEPAREATATGGAPASTVVWGTAPVAVPVGKTGIAIGARPAKPAGEPSIDIRTIPAEEAVAIIANLTDREAIRKILSREKTSTKPKGGRRKVLDALSDRMAELL